MLEICYKKYFYLKGRCDFMAAFSYANMLVFSAFLRISSFNIFFFLANVFVLQNWQKTSLYTPKYVYFSLLR